MEDDGDSPSLSRRTAVAYIAELLAARLSKHQEAESDELLFYSGFPS